MAILFFVGGAVLALIYVVGVGAATTALKNFFETY